MKKKFLKVLVLAIILVLGVLINHFFHPIGFIDAITATNDLLENAKHFKSSKNIEFIDGIYGLYAGSNGSGVIHVVQSKDENHFYICGDFYRLGTFRTDDLKITKNKNNEIIVTEKIYPGNENTDWLHDRFAENQSDYVQMDIIIKNNKMNLIFNNNTTWEFEKVDVKCITEETKNNALANILDSNFKNINKDIFEIIHDTENYLVVSVKSNVLTDGRYELESCPPYGMYRCYNIEKKTKKILKLNDIIKNLDDLNKYIIDSIEADRDKWIAEGRDNYKEFEGIGKHEWFENYFEIDENKRIVKIRCLKYPCEANRGIGDLYLDIPFSFFKLNESVK